MKSNDLEYARIHEKGRFVRDGLQTLRHIFSCLTFLGAIWLIFSSLEKIVADQSVDSLTAIAKIIEALKIGSILGYIWGVGATIAWRRERLGKKRAIAEKKRFQSIAEKNDPNRTSSGLDEFGNTPEGDDDD